LRCRKPTRQHSTRRAASSAVRENPGLRRIREQGGEILYDWEKDSGVFCPGDERLISTRMFPARCGSDCGIANVKYRHANMATNWSTQAPPAQGIKFVI
jgi:hypothetical protein